MSHPSESSESNPKPLAAEVSASESAVVSTEATAPESAERSLGRSLSSIAGIVAMATLLSKVAGLVRQQVIAATFGIGIAYDAYNYAYVIPGFLLILLGGINGPFHSAVVSVVAKRDRREIAPLIETLTTIVGGLMLILTAVMVVFGEPLLWLCAPNLTPETRTIALDQFRIMAPLAFLSGLIGIGFGTLNATNQFWLPSLSPLFSSLTMLAGLGILWVWLGGQTQDPQYALLGGRFLAGATLVGAVLQWMIQIIAQRKAGAGGLRLRFNLQQPGLGEVLRVLGPATFSSGMLYINVWTDLWFASRIPGAAAAFDYANLLVQAPLGILSNVILVPLMPMLSRLTDPSQRGELKQRIRQGLVLTALTMLPLSALMIPLALPIVRVVYERHAFTQSASSFVASMLMAYSLGMFVYLGRDVLVRVFYALGDGDTPFRISVGNIFLNALLNAIFVQFLGAPGLVLATVGVNITSMILLLFFLDRKLGGLPFQEWSRSFGVLLLGSSLAGGACYGTLLGLQQWLGTEGLLLKLTQLSLCTGVGLAVFVTIVSQLRLPEVDLLIQRLKQRFGR